MPDDTDIATATEERDREAALATHRAEQQRQARIAQSMQGYDSSQPIHCLECGEEVPPARLQQFPHTRRCTECASDFEVKNKWKT